MMNYLELKEQKQELIEGISQYGAAIVCIRVNVPGEQKKFAWSEKIHRHASLKFEELFLNQAIKFQRIEEEFCNLFYEYITFYSVKSEPISVKRLTIQLESDEEIGRLLDIDVYDFKGNSISRDEFDIPDRQCYLCSEPAFICGRTRKHSIQELHQFMILKAEMLEDK